MSEALFTLLADAVPSGVDVVVLGFEDDARAAMRARCGMTTYFGSLVLAMPASKTPKRVSSDFEIALDEGSIS